MRCGYCMNTPKEASYIVAGKNYVCKNCMNIKMFQDSWKAQSATIEYIQSKQINRYNLPLDHKYRIVGFDCGGSLLDGGGTVCENCNRLIVNIATVENESGKRYSVGCDCAETLSLVDCNDFWKIKDEVAMHRKFIKWVNDIKKLQVAGKRVTMETEENYIIIFNGYGPWFRLTPKIYDIYFKKLNISEGVNK